MTMPPFFTSPKGKSVLSAGIAVLFTSFFLLAGLACYESNDDMAMIGILSGVQGLTASPDAVFLSLPLGTLLYCLYKLAPAFPWYGVVMYTALAIGCAVGLRVIADAPTALKNKAFSAAAFLGLYMQMVMYLNFTSVSLLLWFCVCARVAQLCLSDRDRLPVFWGYGLLLGFSYLIRPSIIWTVALAFCLPVAVALWSLRKKKWAAALLLPLALTMVVATAWGYASRNTPEDAAYAAFNTARSQFMDTARAENNINTPKALAAVGWYDLDYYLVRTHWWLHDGNLFSAEKLNTFLQENQGSEGSLVKPSKDWKSLTSERNLFAILALVMLVLQTSPARTTLIGHRCQQLRRPIAWSLAATAVVLLLLSMIRFPPRVAMPVLAVFMLYALAFRSFNGRLNGNQSVVSMRAIWGASCLGLAALLLTNFSLSYNDIKTNISAAKAYTDDMIHLAQSIMGKDVIFVNATVTRSFGIDWVHPLREYQDVLPMKMLPSGWLIASPPYNDFLKKHGLIDRKNSMPRMVNNPKIVFAYWQQPDMPYSYRQSLQLFRQQFQMYYGDQFPGAKLKLKTIIPPRAPEGSDFSEWAFFIARTQ